MITPQESLPLENRRLIPERETRDQQEMQHHTLHRNALGFIAILCLCVAAIAPAASMLFNVPVMASEAGAAVPLAFLLSAIVTSTNSHDKVYSRVRRDEDATSLAT